MTTPHYTDGPVTIWHGDCLDVMREMPDNSVNAVVTDPPYSLEFMGKAWDQHDNEDAGFGYYLAGLIDGEGHFRVDAKARRCEFTLKLRDDDEWILRRAIAFIGHGRIAHEPRTGTSNSMATLVIDTKDGVGALCSLLLRYPLRAKKLRDFITWAEAVDEWLSMERGNRWHGAADRTRLRVLGERLREGRSYSEVSWSGNGFQDWCRQWAAEALRVLKPGGHLLSFGGTRTQHRMVAGIEDAGFEIRDAILWVFGSGFPKSLDVSKAIDRMHGIEREVIGSKLGLPGYHLVPGDRGGEALGQGLNGHTADERLRASQVTAPGHEDAARWNGWGTALKPATEIITVARKPLAGGTVAANVLAYGTGALNIDGSRIGTDDRVNLPAGNKPGGASLHMSVRGMPDDAAPTTAQGRWPANVVLDASQAAALDQQSGVTTSKAADRGIMQRYDVDESAKRPKPGTESIRGHDDAGGASRFFKTVDTVAPRFMYTAKAGSDERPRVRAESGGDTSVDYSAGLRTRVCNVCGSRGKPAGGERSPKPWPTCGHGDWRMELPLPPSGDYVSHPTVKPLDLMRWLVKLVTPPGGVVLEPFAGSGTTVEAAVLEGFHCIAIEREADYLPLILQRIRKPHAVGLDLDWDAPTPAPTPIRPAQARTGPRSATPAPSPGFDFGDDWELDA